MHTNRLRTSLRACNARCWWVRQGHHARKWTDQLWFPVCKISDDITVGGKGLVHWCPSLLGGLAQLYILSWAGSVTGQEWACFPLWGKSSGWQQGLPGLLMPCHVPFHSPDKALKTEAKMRPNETVKDTLGSWQGWTDQSTKTQETQLKLFLSFFKKKSVSPMLFLFFSW